jgi:hypothetical protein
MTIKAECTWGEGPDVLIFAEGAEVAAGEHLERPDQAWINLTATEARRLAAELLVAAERAEELAAGATKKDSSSPT